MVPRKFGEKPRGTSPYVVVASDFSSSVPRSRRGAHIALRRRPPSGSYGAFAVPAGPTVIESKRSLKSPGSAAGMGRGVFRLRERLAPSAPSRSRCKRSRQRLSSLDESIIRQIKRRGITLSIVAKIGRRFKVDESGGVDCARFFAPRGAPSSTHNGACRHLSRRRVKDAAPRDEDFIGYKLFCAAPRGILEIIAAPLVRPVVNRLTRPSHKFSRHRLW